MSKLILRAALVGCAAAGLAVAQTPPPAPIHVQPPVPVPTQPVPVPTQPAPATTFVRMLPLAPAKTVLKTFDVADLVCPPADSPLAKPGTDPAMIAAAKAFADVRGEDVLKAVRACDDLRAPTRMQLTTDGKTLVVDCPESVADKVGVCVHALRTARHAMVKVDMVVFTVPSGNADMVKLFGDKPCAAVKADEFNKVLRELKANGAVDVLTRPSLLLTNKQTGFFQVGQPCPAVVGQPACDVVGITTRVTPAVSADLKSVVLDLDLSHSRPSKNKSGVECQQSNTCVVVPDGGTLAVKVGTGVVERKTETKIPVVGDVPYLGRLFTNVGISTEPTDTVAVVTVTRVHDAPCLVAPPPAVAPPPMPTAVPYSIPLVAPTLVAVPARVVGVAGLDRVGGSFNVLTTPPTVAATPTRGWVVEGQRLALPATAPAGLTFTRFAPSDVTVAGGVIGATVGGDDTAAVMAAYKAACAAGRTDDAARLALKLLAKDPTCFGK